MLNLKFFIFAVLTFSFYYLNFGLCYSLFEENDFQKKIHKILADHGLSEVSEKMKKKIKKKSNIWNLRF